MAKINRSPISQILGRKRDNDWSESAYKKIFIVLIKFINGLKCGVK